jgi:hypothetical protein
MLVRPGTNLASAADVAPKQPRHKITEMNLIPEDPLPITARISMASSGADLSFENASRQADQSR